MDQIIQFSINHWVLWLALIIVLLLIIINEAISQKQRAKELTPAALVDEINQHDALIVDLRDLASYQAGHIIHAIHATENDFAEQRMDNHKNKRLILVCNKGLQSSALATKLRKQGFQQTMLLAGGINAWTAANMPLVKTGK
ncbi:MAG: rhodanese-like domain-containing protein [Legionella sp.]